MGANSDKIYKELLLKYKRMSISKKELAKELGISQSSFNVRISKREGIPNFKKLGTAKNAKVIFNLLDVAEFLSETKQELACADSIKETNSQTTIALGSDTMNVADVIYNLSNNPEAKFKGWLTNPVQSVALQLNAKESDVQEKIKILIETGFVLKDMDTGFIGVTNLWWDLFSGCSSKKVLAKVESHV